MMRLFICIFVVLVGANLVFALGMAHAKDPTIEALAQKPLPDFKPPEIKTHTFPNGLKLYFLEDHELPLVEVNAMIALGAVDEPPEKLGITSLMMSGLRSGGAGPHSGDDVDLFLEEKAVLLSVDSGKEISHVKLNSLSKTLNEALKLFFQVLREPKFDLSRLEIAKGQMLDQITRRNEDPEDIALRKFPQIIYGLHSVWARVSTLKTVASTTREDVVDYYQNHVGPQNTWIAVSGDLKFDEAIKLIETYAGDWRQGSLPKRALTPVEKKWQPLTVLIPNPSNQSTLVIGHFGEKRFNPDKYALILANQIFGGSTFISRLGGRVRTALGLAYSVFSSFGFESDFGLFQVVAATKSESTLKVIQEAKGVLTDMLETHPITAAELAVAKDTILNQIIFQYDDSADILDFRMRYDYYGYPPDYLTLFQKEIAQVTLSQVNAVLKKYFFPERFIIVVVGDPQNRDDLKGLGRVRVMPLDDR